jgi:3-oxoacyl-[acyl-carrier protein] reductase
MDLTARVALITGARRIGAEVAVALAQRGADIAIVYQRSRDEADAAAERVRAAGRRALVLQANVSSETDCGALVGAVEHEFGRLDVLVNMASLYASAPLDKTDAAAWTRQLSVDLNGSFFCARAAVPVMRRHGGGRIVNFSDWVAASGRPRYTGYVAYYVAKAGV